MLEEEGCDYVIIILNNITSLRLYIERLSAHCRVTRLLVNEYILILAY